MTEAILSAQPSPGGIYPADLESWWLEQAQRHFNLRDPKTTARRLVDSAGILSDLFTTHRSERFAEAYTGKLPVIAYGNYFFPQTYIRTRFVLSEWLNDRQSHPTPPPGAMRLLDLGGGSGAALVSAADLLQAKYPGLRLESTLLDASTDNLKYFRQLAQDRRPHALSNARVLEGDLRDASLWQREKWDLITASFSLNEAFHQAPDSEFFAWVETAMESLAEDGMLVLIEPALRETSERLERLRDVIASQSARRIVGPCQHREACPLLAGKKFWCHDARAWQVPGMVQRINAVLNRTLWDMKYSFLLLGNGEFLPSVPSPNLFRLTSSFTKEKGKLSATGCAADGSNPRYEILRNHIDPLELRALEKFERGDILQAESLRALGEARLFRIEDPGTLKACFKTRG